MPKDSRQQSKRVLVFGATGYIGQKVVEELLEQDYEVVCFSRPQAGIKAKLDKHQVVQTLNGAEVRFGDVCNEHSLLEHGFQNDQFDAVISCLTTRTGGIEDSWKIDYQATSLVLKLAKQSGVKQFVLLSAICVQKPKLAFQQAKLKFEQELIHSGLSYSIVRPTAFFKSLSGQINAVKNGKPFVVFGNGELTACKPISEQDLARFMVGCLSDVSKQNQILPVGGPDKAITPIQQGNLLFELCNKPAKFRHAPVLLFDCIIPILSILSHLIPSFKDKAEFARIGRYYSSESMLVFNEKTQAYDADITPSFGNVSLREHYKRVLNEGLEGQELGDHSLF